jgi:aldose sugar dehydrogenase
MLYLATGDAGKPSHAQNRATLAGKVLRVTPEGLAPPDNPFSNSPVFLYGLRNPQGFDWLDPKTLAVVDDGPNGDLGRKALDEISFGRSGDNFGWPAVSGCDTDAYLVTPALAWATPDGPGGAAFYTGRAIPEWRGSLLVTALAGRRLHRLVFDPKAPTTVVRREVYFQGDLPDGYGRLRDVVMGPDGDLYITTSNCDGKGRCPEKQDRILRITR